LHLESAFREEEKLEFGTLTLTQGNAIHCAPSCDDACRAVVFGSSVPPHRQGKCDKDVQWKFPNVAFCCVMVHWSFCDMLGDIDKKWLLEEMFEKVCLKMHHGPECAKHSDPCTAMEHIFHDEILKLASSFGVSRAEQVTVANIRNFVESAEVQKFVEELSKNRELFKQQKV